jgi:hypothetical protein
LTTVPPLRLDGGAHRGVRRASATRMRAGSCSHSRELPSMSVNRKVAAAESGTAGWKIGFDPSDSIVKKPARGGLFRGEGAQAIAWRSPRASGRVRRSSAWLRPAS